MGKAVRIICKWFDPYVFVLATGEVGILKRETVFINNGVCGVLILLEDIGHNGKISANGSRRGQVQKQRR